MTVPVLSYTAIHGPDPDPYEEKVIYTYGDDPATWKKIIGEQLLYEWGIYDHPDSPRPVSLDESGGRYFQRQLDLAGLTGPNRPPMNRVLDVGCGWGSILKILAAQFPECDRLDGINVSRRQLEYCTRDLVGLADRINLYLCNARDLALLPDADVPYDLVVLRGVATHFPPALFETMAAALAGRTHPGSLLVISDTLYTDLDTYQSAIPDEVDRQASAHRKSPQYFTSVLTTNGFTITDMRVLPSNTDVAHWLLEVLSNIETHYPQGPTGSFKELATTAVNLSIGLLTNQISAYSIIARH